MTYYELNSFWYDSDTNNIVVEFQVPVDVSYELPDIPGIGATNVFSAQIFLDGQQNLVGKIRPESADGTIAGGSYGRVSGPGSAEDQPLEDAPE